MKVNPRISLDKKYELHNPHWSLVRLVGIYDEEHLTYPVVGLVKPKFMGEEEFCCWKLDGTAKDTSMNLFEIESKPESEPMIDINKKYKIAGPLTNIKGVKLLTILEDEKIFPVIGLIHWNDGRWQTAQWSATGKFTRGGADKLDLVEDVDEPWKSLPIGHEVLVRDHGETKWTRGYYAGELCNRPCIWSGGKTQWSSNGSRTSFDFCIPNEDRPAD